MVETKRYGKENSVRAYYNESYPSLLTKATLYWHRNLIGQALRFVVLNLKMMRILVGGHS